MSKTQALNVGIVLPNDNRTRVPNTTANPARWVGQLETTWHNGDVTYGTATLIGMRHVLTCAHNLFDRKIDKYCKSVKFGPGFNRNANHVAEEPFGTYALESCEVPEEYRLYGGPIPPIGGIPRQDVTKYLHDYAVGRLDRYVRDDLGESAFTPNGGLLVNDLGCHINGYSGDLDPSAHTQYTRNGPVRLTDDHDFVTYKMSTYHGDSGAPVYYKANGQPFWRIVAVHVTGVADVIPANGFNFGPWLVDDRLQWINERLG